MSEINILSGKIAAILNERELVINKGTNVGVKIDMVFKVMVETPLIDPDTNESLGSFKYEKGKVKIVRVEEKYSIARTFETYETNIGGTGLGDITTASGVFVEANRKFFTPEKWVTRVQTLKYSEKGINLKEPTDKEFLNVKIGDIVEIDTEYKTQAE